jgi:hypothetical protein
MCSSVGSQACVTVRLLESSYSDSVTCTWARLIHEVAQARGPELSAARMPLLNLWQYA